MLQDIFGTAVVKSFFAKSDSSQSVLATQANLQSLINQLSSEIDN